MDNMKKLLQQVASEIKIDHMDEILLAYEKLNRLTGTADAENSVDYLVDKLKSHGIECQKYTFDAYMSDPVDSRVDIYDGENVYAIETRPRSFSKNCPLGVEGELIYDKYSTVDSHDVEVMEFFKSFKDKIVLGYNVNEDYIKRAERFGAKGVIQIWPSEENVIHEDTVCSVWGGATLDREFFLPGIPVAGTKKRIGDEIVKALENNKLRAKLCVRVKNKVSPISMPVVEIKGKSDDFVLAAGHYDSWYYGVTDNATGNACCFELCRVFDKFRDKMQRGLRIVWWPAHSNGRYGGSVWFSDNFWDDIYEHCVAQINIDSPGCRGAEVVYAKTAGFEGRDFLESTIKKYTNQENVEFKEIGRSADQSFWGARVPYHLMPRNEQILDSEKYATAGSGGGWWWHTPEDTYDKVDKKWLITDTQILADIIGKFVFNECLPVNIEEYFDKINGALKSADENSDDEFVFKDLYHSVNMIRELMCEVVDKEKDVCKLNRVIKIFAGDMNRLMYSYSGRYEYDNAFPQKLFPYISRVAGIYKNKCDIKDYLFIKTDFVRQRNRFVTEIKKMMIEIKEVLNS